MSYSKKIEYALSFVINLLSHIFVLLVFLISFFFIYVSKLTSQEIDNELKSLISDQTIQLMQYIDSQDTAQMINWPQLSQQAESLEGKYQGNLEEIEQHNQDLQDKCVCFLGLFAMSIFLLVLYFVARGVDLRLKFILLENFVIFSFVGMIEIYFFLNIASKYIPILPNDALVATLDQLKSRLSS